MSRPKRVRAGADAQVRRVVRRARRLVVSAVGRRRIDRELALVEAAYAEVLGRQIDPVGRESWRARVALREASGADAASVLRSSPEYLLGRTGFYEALHRARTEWAAKMGSYDSILDIGGSSPTCPDGALIELGYRYRPTELHILDRPEDDQFHGRPSYDQSRDRVQDWGTVHFHHGHAEDIAEVEALGDLVFDCVFMGQTIEHIDVNRLPEVLAYIRGHLAPNGRFVLDTPNRDLTRLVMGDAMLTHDHTHEYTPTEMAEVLAHHGFRVLGRTGIGPMPRSVATGRFDPHEIRSGPSLTEDPTDCFVFAMECEATT